jgi:hypothetical protein
MKRFQFGILTSLHDDDAVTLLRALDSALACGQINAEVPCMLCNVPERPSDTELARRVEAVKALHSLRRLIFFPSREFCAGAARAIARALAPSTTARSCSFCPRG